MGSSASSRKLLQPHVFAALKAMGTEVKLWGIWVLYGPLKRPGRFINMEPENTHTKKNNSPFSGSVNLWGCSYDDHIWYVNSLALRATGTLHPLSLSAVWSQWTFPKKESIGNDNETSISNPASCPEISTYFAHSQLSSQETSHFKLIKTITKLMIVTCLHHVLPAMHHAAGNLYSLVEWAE